MPPCDGESFPPAVQGLARENPGIDLLIDGCVRVCICCGNCETGDGPVTRELIVSPSSGVSLG